MKTLIKIIILKYSILSVSSFSILVSASQVEASEKVKTFLQWGDVKCKKPGTPECYSELYCKIAQKGDPLLTQNKSHSPPAPITVESDCAETSKLNSYTSVINGFSKISLLKEKPELVLVTMHGLWHTSDQFSPSLERIIKQKGGRQFNTIELTLPGHIKTKLSDEYDSYMKLSIKNKPEAEFGEWIEAMESTISLAKELGNKVILMGHSTGGLLSVIAAKKYPEIVSQLILIEPAIQVQRLRDVGSCGSRMFSQRILNFFEELSKFANAPPVKEYASLGMGCEIQKMADAHLLKRKYTQSIYEYNLPNFDGDGSSIDINNLPEGMPPIPYVKENLSPYYEMGNKIRVPVILFNNEYDIVVSPTANKYFFLGVNGRKKYIAINAGKDFPHSRYINDKSDELADYVIQFTESNFSSRIFGVTK